MRYLTVQDFLWLQMQLSGTVPDFDQARLESAVYTQYGYGSSANLTAQAGRTLATFASFDGFATGNEACALVGTAAFLLLNGRRLNVKPKLAGDWYWKLQGDVAAAQTAIEADSEPYSHHDLDVKNAIQLALDEFGSSALGLARTNENEAA